MSGLKALRTPDLKVIDAGLFLVNLPAPSNNDIDKVMAPLASRPGQRGAYSASTVPRSAIDHDIAQIRSWFTEIAKDGRLSSASFQALSKVSLALEGTRSLTLDKKSGLLSLNVVWHFTGVQAVGAAATLLVLDQRLNIAHRLYQCSWSKCGKFGFDPSPKGNVKHCPKTGHANAARQERFRHR